MGLDLILLVGLLALFFLPVLARASREPTPRGELRDLVRHPFAAPRGVLVQLVGGLLIGVGLSLAAIGGRVGPASTLRAVVGSVVLVAAAALGGWSLAHLRSWRFLAVLDETHELCTTGPYAWVRHPIYAAIDLVGLGTALWVPNVGVLAGALCFVIGGELRARSEESALLERFGDRYRDYAHRVRRLIPGVY